MNYHDPDPLADSVNSNINGEWTKCRLLTPIFSEDSQKNAIQCIPTSLDGDEIDEKKTILANIKTWHQRDIQLVYAHKPSDHCCTLSQIVISLVPGSPNPYIKCSYHLQSHNERTPTIREGDDGPKTKYNLYRWKTDPQKPPRLELFARINFLPKFAVLCSDSGIEQMMDQSIDPNFFDITALIELDISDGYFIKC